MNNNVAKKSWRPGTMIGLLFGGLVLLYASAFSGDGNPLSIRKILHQFNP